jgi:DNA-binding FadR family transcriptional regulator
MGSENAHGCAQDAENGFGFNILERYLKYDDEFLSHIARVAGNETGVSFVNVETKEQSKQWMHTQSPNKRKKFKQILSSRKLLATAFWDRKGVLMLKLMQ